VKNDLYIPSYNQGFACCAAESEYPELWNGLVGAFALELGCTGLVSPALESHGNRISWTGATWGRGITLAGNSGSYGTFDMAARQQVQLPFTVLFSGTITSTATHRELFSFGRTTATDYHYGLWCHALATGAFEFGYGNGYSNGATARRSFSFGSFQVNTRFTVVLSILSPTTGVFAVNGRLYAATPSGTATGAIAYATTNGRIGYYETSTPVYWYAGDIYGLSLVNRGLTAKAACDWSRDPLAPFRLRTPAYGTTVADAPAANRRRRLLCCA